MHISGDRLQGAVEAHLNVRPDEPLPAQYLDYMSALLTGDLGKSMWYSEPVTDLLGPALPRTLLVLGLAGSATALVGVALGVYGRSGNRPARAASGLLASVSAATPVVLIAALGLLVRLLPYEAPAVEPEGVHIRPGVGTVPFEGNTLAGFTMAVGALALAGIGVWTFAVGRHRDTTVARGARLRGVPETRATRAAWIADASGVASRRAATAVWLCAAVPFAEGLAGVEGVGWYLLAAVEYHDYPLLLGSFLALAAIAFPTVLALELAAVVLDARARERWWSTPADRPPSVPLAPFDRAP